MDLGKPFFQIGPFELLKRDAEFLQHRRCLLKIRILVAAHPENAGLVEQGVSGVAAKALPALEGAEGPPGV